MSSASPPSTSQLLWLAVATDPFDITSWEKLLIHAHQSHDLSTIRHTYKSLLQVFPTSATHWRGAIKVELDNEQYEEVERIFSDTLIHLPDVELWKLYIVYTSKSKSPATGAGVSSVTTDACHLAMEYAYEFVLKHVGLDLHAGDVWQDYLSLMQSIHPRTTAESAAKTASVRHIFRRALSVPLLPDDLSNLWKRYETFENEIFAQSSSGNRVNQFLKHASIRHRSVMAVSKQRLKAFEGIIPAVVPRRPSSSDSPEQRTMYVMQLKNWMRYIHFEQYESSLRDGKRVTLAYRQCLSSYHHYPNIWIDFIKFQIEIGSSPGKIGALWMEFREAMPYSMIPALVHADYEEERGDVDIAKTIYDSLLVCKSKEEPVPEKHSFMLPSSVIQEPRVVDIYHSVLYKVHPLASTFHMHFMRRYENRGGKVNDTVSWFDRWRCTDSWPCARVLKEVIDQLTSNTSAPLKRKRSEEYEEDE